MSHKKYLPAVLTQNSVYGDQTMLYLKHPFEKEAQIYFIYAAG